MIKGAYDHEGCIVSKFRVF